MRFRIVYIVASLAGAALCWAAAITMVVPAQEIAFALFGLVVGPAFVYALVAQGTQNTVRSRLPGAHFVYTSDTGGIGVDLAGRQIFAGDSDTGAIFRFDQVRRVDIDGNAVVLTTTSSSVPRVRVTLDEWSAKQICSSLHAELEDYWKERNAAEAASSAAFTGKSSNAVRDPYAILGVRAGASGEELREAYVERLHEFRESLSDHLHPDHERLIAIENAYKTLGNLSGTHGRSGQPGVPWVLVLAAVLVRYPLLGFAIGAGCYYLLATIESPAPVIFMAYVGLPAATLYLANLSARDSFYGAEYVDRWGLIRWGRTGPYRVPNESLFYPMMLSDIGARRKLAGYMYALTKTFAVIGLGAVLAIAAYATLDRLHVPALWTGLASGLAQAAWAAGITIPVFAILAARVMSGPRLEIPASLVYTGLWHRKDSATKAIPEARPASGPAEDEVDDKVEVDILGGATFFLIGVVALAGGGLITILAFASAAHRDPLSDSLGILGLATVLVYIGLVCAAIGLEKMSGTGRSLRTVNRIVLFGMGASALYLALVSHPVASSVWLGVIVIAAWMLHNVRASSDGDGGNSLLQPWLDRPASIFIALVGWGCTIWAGTMLVDTAISRSWPTTNGMIVRSQMEVSRHSMKGGSYTHTYVAYVTYSYNVNGERFVSDRVCFCTQSGFGTDAEDTLRTYPSGKAVLVHYRFRDPKDSVLETDIKPSTVIVPALFGLFLLAIGWSVHRPR